MINDQLAFSSIISKTRLLKENKTYGFKLLEVEFKNADIKLIMTDGLRKNRQLTDDVNKELAHIELYFCLPSYFDTSVKTWPIDWLNRIAEIPQKNQTWFGHGDTIPAGNPPKKIDDQLEANHFILSKPIQLKQYLSIEDCQAEDFKLLAVIPIFQNELDFKLRNSHTILFQKFEKKNVTEKIDLYRTSTCRNRILGIF